MEKNNQKRIDFNNICLSQWFLAHYKFRCQQSKTESSTKGEYSSGKNESLSEFNALQTKKQSVKPKVSCFRKNSEKDLEIGDINEGKIIHRNYCFQPRFLDSSLLLDSNWQNIPLITNNSPGIGLGDTRSPVINSPYINSPEFEHSSSEFRTPFEIKSKQEKFGMDCSIAEHMHQTPLLDIEKYGNNLYLGVKKFKKFKFKNHIHNTFRW